MRRKAARPKRAILALAFASLIVALAAGSGTGEPAATEPSVARLARARFEVADKAYEQVDKAYRQGIATDREAYVWLRRRAKAQRLIPQARDDRMKFLEQYVRQMKEWEAATDRRRKVGGASAMDTYTAQYYELEAEIWLAQARQD